MNTPPQQAILPLHPDPEAIRTRLAAVAREHLYLRGLLKLVLRREAAEGRHLPRGKGGPDAA